jgi:hypothetical protein
MEASGSCPPSVPDNKVTFDFAVSEIEVKNRLSGWCLTSADSIIALREAEWDRQIERDAASGKLDKLFD